MVGGKSDSCRDGSPDPSHPQGSRISDEQAQQRPVRWAACTDLLLLLRIEPDGDELGQSGARRR